MDHQTAMDMVVKVRTALALAGNPSAFALTVAMGAHLETQGKSREEIANFLTDVLALAHKVRHEPNN